ncbi:MAG: hypothetical protein L0Z50_37155 [Verrucomicrobiales bacterium]|nr:hypothetical protein [Verrucomicrobiales bacterium]
MRRVREGTIGILPPGALGVSFFYHLTREFAQNDGTVIFLERGGSKSAQALRARGELMIDSEGITHCVPLANLLGKNLLDAFEHHALPEIALLCPNPDQLPGILNTVVQLLERLNEHGELTPDFDLPTLLLSSNGIYYQRLRQQFVERLEESTLLGRLPDLWPNFMPRIVGRLLRGITIQTGVRDGTGAAAIYRPGPRGITRLAGGDQTLRERACDLLRSRGGWFELARHSSPTRLEFDKALVNLTSNLLGQLYAIDAEGKFKPLRVGEIVTGEREPEIRDLARHVWEVGRAVKAYAADEQFNSIFAHLLETTHQHDDHIPSSLQWIDLRLRRQKMEPKLTPTEEWLLDPLIRYAHAAGLDDTGRYFEELKERVMRKLRLAAEANLERGN